MQGLNLPLRIETVGRDGALVVVVQGELDMATSPQLDEALAEARDTNAASILVDLKGVSFIDSTGLNVLMRHVCAEDDRARFRLTRASAQAQRLFQLTGTSKYLRFVPE